MKNAEYYAERMKALEAARHKKASEIADNIAEQYEYAKRTIDEKIRSWYQRLADNNGVSFEEAQKLLTSSALEEFHWDVKQYIARGRENAVSGEWVKQLENASAKYHITRLESIKIQARQICEEMAQKRLDATAEAAGSAYTEAYYHTAFEVQKGFGVGWSMERIDKRRVKSVLSKPWAADGRDFSERIHADLGQTVEIINREITHMILTGEKPDRAIAEIHKRLGISKSHAATMVYTEGAIFAQAGQKDCYDDLEVEKFIIVETLDSHTCEICGDMDGKIFPMSEWEMGVTAPIFHPRCRGTTAPYFEDMEGTGERFARDVESGDRYYLPKETSYKEWKEMQDSAHGEGTVDKKRRMAYNRSADKNQYEQYVDILGKNAPSTFDDFQNIKYSENWHLLKSYTQSIKSGELTPLVDFEFYKETSAKIDKMLVGIKTSTGLVTTGKSNHFIARTIGSVEQRRNGVSVEDAFEVITNPIKIDPICSNANGKSQRFIGETAAVTINPDTGILIQSNPLSAKKKKETPK